MNTITVARRLATAFGAVILVFLLVGGVALYSSAKLAEANKWNTHTYKVLTLGDEMLESMINMETGARGFLLGGRTVSSTPGTRASRFSTSPGTKSRR
ncbi:hypothetical protein DW355_01705 [Hylemonella gracilis]|uniref:CHASE3 domain-containing protein n=1 Tax=Hylemonella gracilis TaxID=80880 RepID=A0A4P6UH79_9BURK|nr:hypothetical protein DW355_01705 [Hylemonella gracilis]